MSGERAANDMPIAQRVFFWEVGHGVGSGW